MKYIRGAKKNKQKQHTPTEADDSIQSAQFATVVDLLSEGEIQGLDDGHKSIYLDGTPILDTTGATNYQGYSVVTRNGTQDQTYVPDLSTIENEIPVGTRIDFATPIAQQINDSTVDRIRVTVSIPALRYTEDDGDVVGTSVSLRIEVQYAGQSSYSPMVTDTISGKSSSLYKRDYIFGLAGTFPVSVRVVRLTGDTHTEGRTMNDLHWSSYTLIKDDKLRYPNSALAYLRFDSRQFNSVPRRKYKIRGIKVKLPSNASVDTTTHIGRVTYSGVWDGTFGAATWTNDPAWCLYDLIISTRYGAGIPESSLDKWDFYNISQYCNELVSDGKGFTEPRFACNLLINAQDEVYTIIQQLTSLFRGMSHYSAGSLVVTQDKPTDSQYLIGPSNVIDGAFSYSGTSQKARHTVATVAYQTYDSLGEVQYEYVEDADAVAKYGVINKSVKALGCYSQGQAHRYGLWLLKSEQLLTQTCTFGVSIESGIILRPGMVIDIADPTKNGNRRSGRVSSATTTAITVDSSADLNTFDLGNNPKISVMMPGGTVETKAIPAAGISGSVISITGSFSEAPNSQAVWLLQSDTEQSQQYRIISVAEGDKSSYSVTALEYNSTLYANVDSGDDIVLRDITDLSAEPKPVSQINGTEFLYQDGQGIFVGVVISWKQLAGEEEVVEGEERDSDYPDRRRISSYSLQYKIDNDNWTSVTTGSPSITLRNMREGRLYIQIQALNYLGRGSTIVSYDQLLAGKTGAPGNVQGLMMIPSTSSMARLFWDESADLDVIVGGWVRVRHSPETSNVTWATATSIHADLPGSAKEAYCDLKGGTYLAKFIDSSGVESIGASLVEFTKPDLENLVAVNTQTENGTFPGAKTQLAVDSGTNELRMAPDGGTSGGNATFHTSGTYLFQNNPIDLGGVYSVRLNSTVKVRGYFPYAVTVDTHPNWDAISSVDGVTPQSCDVKLYIRTTQLTNPGSEDWTSWRLFHNAEFSARKYELKAECVTGGSLQQIAIQTLKVEALAATRTINASGTTLTTGDLAITFSNAFLATPSVGIIFNATASGEYYKITGDTANGFSVSIYNSSNQRVARAFHWTATGYGKSN